MSVTTSDLIEAIEKCLDFSEKEAQDLCEKFDCPQHDWYLLGTKEVTRSVRGILYEFGEMQSAGDTMNAI